MEWLDVSYGDEWKVMIAPICRESQRNRDGGFHDNTVYVTASPSAGSLPHNTCSYKGPRYKDHNRNKDYVFLCYPWYLGSMSWY